MKHKWLVVVVGLLAAGGIAAGVAVVAVGGDDAPEVCVDRSNNPEPHMVQCPGGYEFGPVDGVTATPAQ